MKYLPIDEMKEELMSMVDDGPMGDKWHMAHLATAVIRENNDLRRENDKLVAQIEEWHSWTLNFFGKAGIDACAGTHIFERSNRLLKEREFNEDPIDDAPTE